MTEFWLVCALMLIIALVILLPSFFRNTESESVDRNEENIKFARLRMAELRADADAGLIAKSDFLAAREELEQTLLGDLDRSSGSRNRHSHPIWPGLVTILLPLSVIGLYIVVGTPDALVTPVVAAVKVTDGQVSITSAETLETRSRDDASKIEEQLQLAQEYMAKENYRDAAATLETLRARVGNHPVILVRNANALAMANNGNLEGRPLELVDEALAIDPNQPQGLWLAGMAAFQDGENRQALEHWRRLEPLLQRHTPDAIAGIRKLIEQAEDKLGSDEVVEITESSVDTESSLLVTVKLDKRLYDQVALDDRLFVFVQSIPGAPVPLAVVSKRVEDLPLTVTLNDAMAMLPEMKLSNFENVRVAARISRSGDAVPQSGDFRGEISPVRLADTQVVEVLISEIIP